MQSEISPYILVAPTGARRGRRDHSELPVSMDQIVGVARACFAVGADGLHLHVRDAEGRHSLDGGLYLETIAELRQAVPKMDIQITTEAAGVFDVPAQFACLEQVRPEWASISVREISRSPEWADRVYGLCSDQGTRVQHILYDAEDAALLLAEYVRENRGVDSRHGNIGSQTVNDQDAEREPDSPLQLRGLGEGAEIDVGGELFGG